MLKKYRYLKWALISLVTITVILVLLGVWFMSLLPSKNSELENSLVENLPYLSENQIPQRGKILAVVTSTEIIGNTDKATGYELTELSRAYYVFKANGFEVDVASPLGGRAPVVIDGDDMGAFDYAFLNDTLAQHKISHTSKLENIIPEDYDAVFFAGGKGAMFDFPDNKTIQSIVRSYYQSNKVIGAVCHGPAALVNVVLDNGKPLIENKKISGFTNKEELLLISDAKSIFPFLLQDRLVEQGALFQEGSMYLEKVSHDNNLITGQNPWSTWALAENMIKQLGYTPKLRTLSDEENAVKVLNAYSVYGSEKAKEMIERISIQENKPINRVLIASHGAIAAMKWEMGTFYDMIELVSFASKSEEDRFSKN